MEVKLTQSSLPSPIFNPSSFLPKHFAELAKRWKLDIQRITWKGRDMSYKILVHVVKEGETLPSISKLYGVPILEIAASNKDVVDIDLGQHLKIPCTAAAKLCHFEERYRWPNEWHQICTLPSPHQFPFAKTTGSFPVLVPLVAFCIIAAFQIIVAKNSRHKAAKNPHGSTSARWRTALSDLRDPDTLDAQSAPDSDSDGDASSSEEKELFGFEDTTHSCNKLEGEYQKFLSECGMSNYGYWRGGSPQ